MATKKSATRAQPTVKKQNKATSSVRGQDAYQKLSGWYAKLSQDKVKRAHVPIHLAAGMVLRRLPLLNEYRDELKALPGFNIKHLDHLGSLAEAALYVVTDQQQTTESAKTKALIEEARWLLRRLMSAGATLTLEGVIDGRPFEAVPSGRKHTDLARDVYGVATAILGAWSEINGRTMLAREDVERAQNVGVDLLGRLSEGGEPEITAQERSVSFSAMREAYDDVRAGLQFILRETGDVDAVAPPLSVVKVRPRTRSAGDEDSSQSEEGTAPPPVVDSESMDSADVTPASVAAAPSGVSEAPEKVVHAPLPVAEASPPSSAGSAGSKLPTSSEVAPGAPSTKGSMNGAADAAADC